MKSSFILTILALIACASRAQNSGTRLVDESFDKSCIETEKAMPRKLEFAQDNHGGKALKILTASHRIYFPGASSLNLNEGTVEFMINFSVAPKDIIAKSWSLFRASTATFKNGFYLIHGWKRGLIFIVADKDGQRFNLKYPKTIDWKENEWHHIAATWRIENPGKSSIALYVDYKLVDKKDGLSIYMDENAWNKRIKEEASPSDNKFYEQGIILGGWGTNHYEPHHWLVDNFRIHNNARIFINYKTIK